MTRAIPTAAFTFLFFIFLLQGTSFAEDEHPCAALMDATKEEYGAPGSVDQPESINDVWKITWTYPGAHKFTFYWSTSRAEPCHRSGESIHADGSIRSYPNEPDGFRKLKWGVSAASLQDLHFMLTDENGTKYYKRKNEKPELGEAKLKVLLYGFWKGKFYTIYARFEGSRNWEIIKGSLFEKFGEGRKLQRGTSFGWKGGKTLIIADYNEISAEGSLSMYSDKIQNEIDASLNKAIKRSVDAGF